jgi:hypothetical protein
VTAEKKPKKRAHDVSTDARNSEFEVTCLKQCRQVKGNLWCDLCGSTFSNVRSTIQDHLNSEKHKKYVTAKSQTVLLCLCFL